MAGAENSSTQANGAETLDVAELPCSAFQARHPDIKKPDPCAGLFVVNLKNAHFMSTHCYLAFMERMAMFGFLADKAKALSETVSEKVASAKDLLLDSVGEGANVAVDYLDKNWPHIERVLVDGMLTVTHDRIKDDEVFLFAAEKAFELLPAPVRLILPRAAFLAHSEKHRATIVEKIESKRLQRLTAGEAATVEPGSLPSEH